MCGRFAVDLPVDLIRALFGTAGPVPNSEPSWNIAPTQSVPVVRHHAERGERRLDLLRWGLIPHWSKDQGRQPINARAETVASSGMFKGAGCQAVHCSDDSVLRVGANEQAEAALCVRS